MRDGFAHGEHHLVVVELSLEEERQRLVGGDRLRRAFQQALQAALVVLVQLRDADVQAVEDALVGGQHAHIGRAGGRGVRAR